MGRETGTTLPGPALAAAVEKALVDHPGVLHSAVVPGAAGSDGSAVGVVVVLGEMYGVLDVREDLRAALGLAGHLAEPAVLAVARMPEGPLAPVEELAGPSGASRYEPPGSALETDLAVRLARLLGQPRVGVLDDFVELGGDSLTAVSFLNTVQEAYDVPVSLVELFTAGSVREIARLMADRFESSQGPG
ncbi:phosphopantetheine-binding protein [Kitasatospora sp. McL0602]|uniref:phosphopantetheine-binding protein n=1 Tax=Kitasatospora sp. McL0602 TaxID=3439530 RepID=UPI003F8B4121